MTVIKRRARDISQNGQTASWINVSSEAVKRTRHPVILQLLITLSDILSWFLMQISCECLASRYHANFRVRTGRNFISNQDSHKFRVIRITFWKFNELVNTFFSNLYVYIFNNRRNSWYNEATDWIVAGVHE